MQTYEVTATRAGKWWALEVAGLKLGYTQARRLAEVEPTVRELIAGLTGQAEDSFSVTVHVDVPDTAAVETAERLREKADEAKEAADQASRRAALALVAANIPVRDIATMLHVSPGWVSVLTRTDARKMAS